MSLKAFILKERFCNAEIWSHLYKRYEMNIVFIRRDGSIDDIHLCCPSRLLEENGWSRMRLVGKQPVNDATTGCCLASYRNKITATSHLSLYLLLSCSIISSFCCTVLGNGKWMNACRCLSMKFSSGLRLFGWLVCCYAVCSWTFYASAGRFTKDDKCHEADVRYSSILTYLQRSIRASKYTRQNCESNE